MIKREPASIVEIDKAAREIRVCRWYPVGKRRRTHIRSLPYQPLKWKSPSTAKAVPFTGHGFVLERMSLCQCRCSGIKPESRAKPFCERSGLFSALTFFKVRSPNLDRFRGTFEISILLLGQASGIEGQAGQFPNIWKLRLLMKVDLHHTSS